MTDLIARDYLRVVLEEEFPATYLRFLIQGILTYELTNMLELCAPIMKGLDKDDRFLRYEVIGTSAAYLGDE